MRIGHVCLHHQNFQTRRGHKPHSRHPSKVEQKASAVWARHQTRLAKRYKKTY